VVAASPAKLVLLVFRSCGAWPILFLLLLCHFSLNLLDHAHERLTVRGAHDFKHAQLVYHLQWQRLSGVLHGSHQFFDLFFVLPFP